MAPASYVAPLAGAVIVTSGAVVSGPLADWAAVMARRALMSGSGTPSGSGVVPEKNPLTCHCPWPAHVGAPATDPSGHSPEDCMIAFTWAGVRVGSAARTRAATPAANGEAIDVPELVPSPPPTTVELTLTPGAVTSTTVPQLEKLASVSSHWFSTSGKKAQPAEPGVPSRAVNADTAIVSA